MSTHYRAIAGAALLSLAPAGPFAETDPTLVLRGLDPLELIDGREAEGFAELHADHGGYRYRFLSESNRELFLSDPERYGVQWDGACGRMGPLSGTGHPDRFAVWNERIWLFASDPCRKSFLKAPEKLVPIDEAPPAADDAAKAAGQALLETAAAALGDLAALDAQKGVHVHQRLKTTSGGVDWHGTRDFWFTFPDKFRFEEAWSGRGYGHGLTGDIATRFQPVGRQPLGSASLLALRREALREPLWILRLRKELLAVAAGRDTVGGQPVTLVTVHGAGQNVTLALDEASGRLVELRHTGLTARGMGPIVRRITAWQKVGELTLPVRIQEVGQTGLVADSLIEKEGAAEAMVELDPGLEIGHFGEAQGLAGG
jgi:YHS domain-containing protein